MNLNIYIYAFKSVIQGIVIAAKKIAYLYIKNGLLICSVAHLGDIEESSEVILLLIKVLIME